ncbi:MAG: hypothetical protein ACREP5_04540, partial [Candidatus Binatia bacterium]
MLALVIASLVKELENVADVLGERCQCALIFNIAKDADFGDAVSESEWLRDVCDANRRDHHERGDY